MALSAFQRRVDRTARHYRALIILCGGLPYEMRRDLDAEIAAIPNLSRSPLEKIEEACADAIHELDTTIGLLASPDYYIRLVEEAMANPMQLFFIPKIMIDSQLFRNFGAIQPRWAQYPPHTRFGMDARGTVPFTGATVEWRLLDAALFEDMAMLWNECLDNRNDDIGIVGDFRIPVKRYGALRRSTARAVFALLEGYINGVGVNIRWKTDVQTLPAAQRELLTERADDGRMRFKRFRDKVMQYPKLAIGALHPPIPENNPELALILAREREWRDAVMHPTPLLEEDRQISRERTFFEIELEELQELVDAAVSLIRQIDTALAGRFGTASLWLHHRGPGDRFPNEAFH